MIETLINNRYLILSELGRGGMGVVYRAHDTLLERDVAVKVLWSAALGSQGRARLLREAQAAARLNHPNIINIFDAGDSDGMSYIIMELLDGESLFERRPATLDESLRVLRQICDALEHAHSHGIIHRDLKPENVIVTSNGVAKLTDFGLSRSLTGRISQEGIIVGTVYYLAPEQALRQDIDSRADLYALGVLAYELVTGRLPFTADDPLGVISQHLNAPVVPPSTYNANIPPALDVLILRLMSKRPEDRPSSAAEVRAALDRLYDEPGEVDTSFLAELSPLDRLGRGRLVGRREEFNRFKGLWRDVMGEGPTSLGTELPRPANQENVSIISGEPGVGKTPLIKEINSLAQISGAQVVMAECYASDIAPYAPVIQLLRKAQPLPEGLPDIVFSDLQALAPDLVARPVGARPQLNPISEQQRIFESLFALFSTLAERQPVLLILEDAHWADESSLLLLRHLSRRSRAAHLRLMIVVTYRPDEMERNTAFQDMLLQMQREHLAITIELAPFNREQTRELLTGMFTEEISDGFVDSIYKVTEGNLFFIEEICKALIEEGKIYCDGGHWQISGVEEMELPQSVRVALQLRINRLPEAAQDLLRLAAVIGREFDYEILLRSCEQQNEDRLIEALEQAERAQLISEVRQHGPTGGYPKAGATERFAFAHTLIPAILHEEISSLRRRRMHRRIAEAVEAVRPDDLETLAFHFGQAGDQDKARLYTLRAGDRARKLYANNEALRFYREALELTPADHADRFHILSSRAQVYDLLAQREAQRQDIEAMLNLAEMLDDATMRCDAVTALAEYFLVTENVLSKEPSIRAVEIARSLNDPVREARALRCAGWSAWIHHEYHESLSALETAVARFRKAGMLVQAAGCLHMLSLVTGLQGLGEQEISKKYAEDAIQLSQMAGDPRQEAISLRRLAIVHMDKEDYAKGLEFAQRALNLHRELGDRYEECNAMNAVGVIVASMGRFDEARQLLTQSYQMALEIGSNMGIWMTFANLMYLIYIRDGQYEAAIQFTEQQLAHPLVVKDPFLRTNMLQVKVELLSQIGQFPAALEQARELLDMANRHSGPLVRAGVHMLIARIYGDMHRFEDAEAALEEARTLSRTFERPVDLAYLYTVEAIIARLEWEAGDLKQIRRAATLADQALALLRFTHWNHNRALALDIAAWVALAQNHPDQALAFARDMFEYFDQQPVAPELFEYTYACALWANGMEEPANTLLERAYARVMKIANATQDENLRKSWLEDTYLTPQVVSDWVNYHGV